MTRQEYMDKLLKLASEIDDHGYSIALHLFTGDGNCSDADLRRCLSDETITPSEKEFMERLLDTTTEDERYAAYELTEYPNDST